MITGAPRLGAWLIAPEADVLASLAEALRLAAPSTTMEPLECTRHWPAWTWLTPVTWMSSDPSLPMLRTHSGAVLTARAVALTVVWKPPGGSRSPKNEARWVFMDTVRVAPWEVWFTTA